jgi:hypothetical protein
MAAAKAVRAQGQRAPARGRETMFTLSHSKLGVKAGKDTQKRARRHDGDRPHARSRVFCPRDVP